MPLAFFARPSGMSITSRLPRLESRRCWPSFCAEGKGVAPCRCHFIATEEGDLGRLGGVRGLRKGSANWLEAPKWHDLADLAVVVPTGFEPVLEPRPRFRHFFGVVDGQWLSRFSPWAAASARCRRLDLP